MATGRSHLGSQVKDTILKFELKGDVASKFQPLCVRHNETFSRMPRSAMETVCTILHAHGEVSNLQAVSLTHGRSPKIAHDWGPQGWMKQDSAVAGRQPDSTPSGR